MKMLQFDRDAGRSIRQYGSVNVGFSGIARILSAAQIGAIHFSPGGTVGYHQAVTRQLFLVVEGSGWVRGGTEERSPISAAQAVLWEQGEWHESGSEPGMTAIVIEADDISLLDTSAG